MEKRQHVYGGLDGRICIHLCVIHSPSLFMTDGAGFKTGYFPRTILLLPHVILLTILLTTYSARNPDSTQQSLENPAPTLSPYLPEGSKDWYANIQGIQNLMGLLYVFQYSSLLTIIYIFSSARTSTTLL